MQKNLFYLFSFLFALWVWLPSCKKSDFRLNNAGPYVNYWDTLPAITQQGANTFGCLVDGDVWVPHTTVFTIYQDFSSRLVEENGNGNGSIRMGIHTTNIVDLLKIQFNNNYFLPTSYTSNGGYFSNPTFFRPELTMCRDTCTNEELKFYQADTTLINPLNFLNIEYIDTSKNIFSGTFGFVLYRLNNDYSLNHNDSVVVTDGRFDLNYLTY